MENLGNRMARNASEPLPFMDQVMEICDRILDKQPAAKNGDREKQEESESSSKVPPPDANRP